MRKTSGYGLVLLGLLVVAIFATYVVAEPLGATGVTNEGSERGTTNNSSSQSVSAQAGNVTQLSINASQLSQAWAGYYGNVTGQIVLQDANLNNFYLWNSTTVTGEVYASRNDSVEWSTIGCANATHVDAENTFIGTAAGDTESVNSTYTGTSPSFDVGTTTVSSCIATNAYSNNITNSNLWHQVLLADTNNNTVYTTIMNASNTGFDGDLWDFQLLVGEDGHGAAASTLTTYYFYVELG